jgi:hypothetical protein
MDPFHVRLARVGLAAIARYGFCLAGGYAVQAHGFVLRRSEDVDLFTTASVEDEFPDAVADLVAAYESDGLTTIVSTQASTFARLNVADSITGESARVELGVDWRAYPPVQLELGPFCTRTTPLRTRSVRCTGEERFATTLTLTASCIRVVIALGS